MAEALDAAFEQLTLLYQADPAAHLEKFALLFVETLQSDPTKALWSELSEKFPACVRVWAMDSKKCAFKKSLDIDSDVFDRWHAELELQIEDTSPESEERQTKVAECLRVCSNLMFKLILAEKPTCIVALGQVMDSAYSPTLQLRMIEISTRALLKLVPNLFTKSKFHLFKECVRESELHQKKIMSPSEESRAAHFKHINALAFQLHDEVVKKDNLSDTLLDKYSLAVQQHAMGSLQAVLMARLQNPQRLDELRKKMSEINEGFDPYYNRKILLLRNLRLKLKLSRKTGRVIANTVKLVIQTLPVKIILTVIKEAEDILPVLIKKEDDLLPAKIQKGKAVAQAKDTLPVKIQKRRAVAQAKVKKGTPKAKINVTPLLPLDIMLLDALRNMPPSAVLLPLQRYGLKIVAATPSRYKYMVQSAIDVIRHENAAWGSRRKI